MLYKQPKTILGMALKEMMIDLHVKQIAVYLANLNVLVSTREPLKRDSRGRYLKKGAI